jgi:hypothetical protein
MQIQEPSGKLSNLQLELLKIFSFNVPEEQLLDIKEILSRYFAEKASDEMDRLWEERGWTNDTMEQWLEERMRTPYK